MDNALTRPARAAKTGRASTLLALGLTLAQTDAADASAWNVEAGTGFADVDVTLAAGDRYFDKDGRLLPARAYRKGEAGGYVEYGITDWLMAVARPSLEMTRVGAPGGGSYTGPGATEAALQLHLLTYGPAVAAVQGSFSLPGTTSHTSSATVGNTARDGEVRALGGVGFAVGPFPAFAELQIGYRIRSDGGAPQWHGDATFGLDLTPKLKVLIQSFNQAPIGAGTVALPSATYSDLKVSLVREIASRWSLQVGVDATVFGRKALKQTGAAVGVWHRF